jgi:hypothetical protein
MVTCAFPLLSVKDCADVMYVEFKVWMVPMGDRSVALKSMRTLGLGVPEEFVSWNWKVVVCPGAAEVLPVPGVIQAKWSPWRATSLLVAVAAKFAAAVSIDEGRLKMLGL